MRHLHSKTWLAVEVVALMIGLPTLFYFYLPIKYLLPTIWATALLCQLGYRGLTEHSAQEWWGKVAFNWGNLKPLLLRFALCAVLVTGATYFMAPEMLFSFVKQNPYFWLLVMLAYPILSVVPQEIIFRSFFFARYQTLFSRPWVIILASGLAFAFAHILFHNWVAPMMCLVGGLMFAQTFQKTRSLGLVALEHALYGDLMFTVGLGKYFYHGTVAAAATAVSH